MILTALYWFLAIGMTIYITPVLWKEWRDARDLEAEREALRNEQS